MAKPTEKVRLQKQEILSLGGDPNDVSADPTPLDPTEDVAQVAGVEFCAPGKVGDSKVMIWREGDALAFEDPIAGVRTLNDLLTYTQAHSHAISDVNGLQAALNGKGGLTANNTWTGSNTFQNTLNTADILASANNRLRGISVLPAGYVETTPINFRFDQDALRFVNRWGGSHVITVSQLSGSDDFSPSEIDNLFSQLAKHVNLKGKPDGCFIEITNLPSIGASASQYVWPYVMMHIPNSAFDVKMEVFMGPNSSSGHPGGWETAYEGPVGSYYIQQGARAGAGMTGVRWTFKNNVSPGAPFDQNIYLRWIGVIERNGEPYRWTLKKGGDTVYGDLNVASPYSLKVNNNAVWHAGNDGSGSGLDADLLDGQHGSFYRDLSNATGVLSSSQLSTSPGVYIIDPRPAFSESEKYITLDNPTLLGLSLFGDSYVFDGTAGNAPNEIEYTNDGTTWISYTQSTPVSESNVRKVWSVQNDTSATLTIPNGCQSFRMTWTVTSYYYWKYIYLYQSYNGNYYRIVLEKGMDDGAGGITWENVGTYDGIHGWPAHVLISHPRISASPTGPHARKLRITIVPTWSNTSGIIIYHMKWMCTYPAGAGRDKPFFMDYDRNLRFYGSLQVDPDKPIGTSLTQTFRYDGKTMPHYGIQWSSDSELAGALWQSGEGGIRWFTNGQPRMKLQGSTLTVPNVVADSLRVGVNDVWHAGNFDPATKASLGSTAPQNVLVQTASAGTSNEAARADHKHNVSVGTPVAIGTVNSAGTATSLARSNHVHAHGTINAADSHPISAITGLQEALDGKFSTSGGNITGNVAVTGNISLTGNIDATGGRIDAFDAHLEEVFTRSFWSAYPVNSTDTAFQFYTGPHLGKLFSIKVSSAEKFYIDNNGDAWANGVKLGGSYTLPAASTSTRGGIKIGDGLVISGWPDVVSVSTEIIERSRSLFTLNGGSDPLVWKIQNSGEELFNMELHRFKVDLSYARMVRMSMILVYSEGKDGELVLEGSTDGGHNWGPLDGGMTGSMGPGGPAIMTIVGGPSSEYQMSGGRDTHLTSGWTQLDSKYHHYEVWLRIVYYGKPQNLEFGSISAEATYYDV